MTVLDLSSNDLSTLDPECFRANGVTGGIVGVFSSTDAPGRMRAAAQACRDAGLTLHGFYGLIYFGDAYGELRDTHWAIQLALEFGVGRVWLDCETDAVDNGWTQAPRPTPAQRVEAIRRAVAEIEAAGLSAGIYTGSWWWPSGTGNTTEFAHLPLWNSYYDGDPDPDGLPYGGWTVPAVEQYSSTFAVCGRNRDVNYIYEEEAEPMTPAEKADYLALLERVNRSERIIAGNGIDVDGQRLTGEAALAFLDGDGASLALGQGMLQAHTHKVLPNPAGPVTGGPLYQ